MFIDVGASSRAACPVKVGEVAAFDRPFLDLGDRLVAKSMDDRIGCLVAIETLRALTETPNEVYFVFTTQEEVGTRGAETSAFGIDPDLGFSLDVTGWGDTPGRKHFDIALGKGRSHQNQRWRYAFRSAHHPLDGEHRRSQRHPLSARSAAGRLPPMPAPCGWFGPGCRSGCISIPCRYVHSPSEMVDYNDVQNAVKLATALLANPVEL